MFQGSEVYQMPAQDLLKYAYEKKQTHNTKFTFPQNTL